MMSIAVTMREAKGITTFYYQGHNSESVYDSKVLSLVWFDCTIRTGSWEHYYFVYLIPNQVLNANRVAFLLYLTAYWCWTTALFYQSEKKTSCGKVIQKPVNVNMLFLWAWVAATHCSVGSPSIGLTPRQLQSPLFFQTSIQTSHCDVLLVCPPVILVVHLNPGSICTALEGLLLVQRSTALSLLVMLNSEEYTFAVRLWHLEYAHNWSANSNGARRQKKRLFIDFQPLSRAEHLLRCTNTQPAGAPTYPRPWISFTFTPAQPHRFHPASETDILKGIFHPFFSGLNYSLHHLLYTPIF